MWDKQYVFYLLLFTISGCSQTKQYTQHTIAFYNVENLFDTINNPKKNDDEFTPESIKRWNTEKYNDKVENIAKAIRMIGADEKNTFTPTIIGLCEVENRQVIEDVIYSKYLKDLGYEIIHFESPDSRGIDVALVYQKQHFFPLKKSKHQLLLHKSNGYTSYTRDQLLVTGLLDKEEIHIIVNHWPSRVGGENKSKPKRIAAAQLNRKIVDSLLSINPQAKIITMGDFNDGPNDYSIQDVLKASGQKEAPSGLYNPMYVLSEQKGLGTLAYRDTWELFDQIIISKAFLKRDYTGFQFRTVQIVNPPSLRQPQGRYKGYPLRNTDTKAGYSDHFPVYITLVREVLE